MIDEITGFESKKVKTTKIRQMPSFPPMPESEMSDILSKPVVIFPQEHRCSKVDCEDCALQSFVNFCDSEVIIDEDDVLIIDD